MRIAVVVVLAWALAPLSASANGRPPETISVRFKPGDGQSLFVGSTFGPLISPDGCSFYWLCEANVGFGGTFDPDYAITSQGTILATTFNGLSVSRDGGCSFSVATSQLSASDPGNISQKYLTAVDVGPTGEICVVSADASSDNGVYCSTDEAMTFSLRAGLPNVPEYRTIKIAPSDPQRQYVSAHEISQPNPEGGLFPPTGHLYRSDDDGGTWTEETVTDLVSAPSPQFDVMAVSPANADVVFLRSAGAHPPEGDVLLRSTDGAVTFTDVLETTDAIDDVIAKDASTIFVVTSTGTLLRSSDGGVTFDAVPTAPPLTCLGLRSDGTLFGCASLAITTHDALFQSADDGMTWKKTLALAFITGPLQCPAGTAEHDVCDQSDWRTVATQLGVVPSTCGAGPDPVGEEPVDAPAGTAPPAHGGGCCDSGGSPDLGSLVLCVSLVLATTRRRRPGRAAAQMHMVCKK